MLPIRSTERTPFDATVLRWAMLLNGRYRRKHRNKWD